MPTKNKRSLDKVRTMKNYEERIRKTFGREDYSQFEGAWIGTYKIFSTSVDVVDDPDHNMYCHAMILLKIVREHGINCKGVCSERVSNGQYISSPRERDEEMGGEKVIYVDSHNYFTGKTTSPFTIRKYDKVYIDNDSSSNS